MFFCVLNVLPSSALSTHYTAATIKLGVDKNKREETTKKQEFGLILARGVSLLDKERHFFYYWLSLQSMLIISPFFNLCCVLIVTDQCYGNKPDTMKRNVFAL